jgi:hypothetical protein
MNVAMEKESWQKLLRKARAYVGLSRKIMMISVL